jgi:hypothetical protein
VNFLLELDNLEVVLDGVQPLLDGQLESLPVQIRASLKALGRRRGEQRQQARDLSEQCG